MENGELFPRLERPVPPPYGDVSCVEARLDVTEAAAMIEAVVRGGVLRPYDITSAQIGPPAALWVPFWRVAVSIDDLHVDLSERSVARHREAAILVSARAAFPYEARLPSILGRAANAPLLEVAEGDLERGDVGETMSGQNAEVLDADVTREKAESIALGVLIHALSPTHAIHANYEPRIHGATFCYYPVYYARYAYTGEARRRVGEEYFVAISARTGQVIAGAHPSAARSVAAKVRRILSFDRR